MPEKVRVAVIGAGGIANLRHLPAYKQAEERGDAELVAVCDPVESAARAAAERFGVPEVFADYRALLDPAGAGARIDAVSICTPNSYHEPITLAALAAGKHVLCEKPLALDLAGARRMCDAARAAGVVTAVNFRYRFIPAAGFVRDLIARGELGAIYHVYGNYLQGPLSDPTAPLAWRLVRAQSGSGALGDLASHLVDLYRFWVGELAAVQGHLRTFVTERPMVGGGTGTVDVDDATSILLRFASGAEGVINASRCAIGHSNHQRVEVYGTKGAVVYQIERWDQGGDSLQICLDRRRLATTPSRPSRFRRSTSPATRTGRCSTSSRRSGRARRRRPTSRTGSAARRCSKRSSCRRQTRAGDCCRWRTRGEEERSGSG